MRDDFEWIKIFGLKLLNSCEECIWLFTRQRDNLRSTLDFALTNKTMSRCFSWMFIDEEHKIFDLSDHNLVQVNLNKKMEKNNLKKRKMMYY